MDEYLNKLKHKLERNKEKLQQEDLPLTTEKHTCHGGWTIGYLQGKITLLEDIIDDLEEIKEKSNG